MPAMQIAQFLQCFMDEPPSLRACHHYVATQQ
jgi:hypothetical protein